MSKDFEVKILNADQVTQLFEVWGQASVKCYNTPKKFATRVGKSCLNTKHFSGSRGQFIIFEINNVPRALVDQLVRHEVGVFKNVESQRYVNYEESFYYYTPPLVQNDEDLLTVYNFSMEIIKQHYEGFGALIRSKYPNLSNEQVNEISRGLLPMNINSSLVIGFTVEALINLCHKRLCVCSQEHIHKLVKMMKKLVVEIHPELDSVLVPVCVANNYCPESATRSCGAYPQKIEVDSMVKLWRESKNNKE